jgi:hypothetical protein
MDEVEKIAPITKSPLDAYRGSGRHAKKNTTQASDETIVLDTKPKEKKKPGRKKKEKPLIRFHISNEPVVLVFD